MRAFSAAPSHVVLVLFLAVSPFCRLTAEDQSVSFTIAPPPVGYPLFQAGDKVTQTGANALYLGIDLGEERLKAFGVGAFGSLQQCFSDRFAAGLNGGGAVLAGSKYDLLLLQLPLAMSGTAQIFKVKNASLFAFASAGGNMGLTLMTVTVPQLAGMTLVNDDTTLSTTTVIGALSGGLQLNYSLGPLIISPFGIYSYTRGSYSYSQSSSMSFSYPSGSGTVEGQSSWIFGFDVLYTPLDMALSSQVRNTDSYTLVSIALKWLLPQWSKLAGKNEKT